MMDVKAPVPTPYAAMETPTDWAPYGDAATSPGMTSTTMCPTGWTNGRTILDIWSYEDSSGVWVHVDGIGWKRLSPASRPGHTHMTLLAGAATHNNLPVDFHVDADGQIDQLIV